MVLMPPLLAKETDFWSPSKFGERACNMFLEKLYAWQPKTVKKSMTSD
jgi:hypothetical protein